MAQLDQLIRRAGPGSTDATNWDMFLFNKVAYTHFWPRVASFKMATDMDRPHFEQGVFVRYPTNPFVHDRDRALAILEQVAQRLRSI